VNFSTLAAPGGAAKIIPQRDKKSLAGAEKYFFLSSVLLYQQSQTA